MDRNFQLALGVANAIVAVMNAVAYAETLDVRDAVSSIAWFGSMAYWLWKASIS